MSYADYAHTQTILAVTLIGALLILVLLLAWYEFGPRRRNRGKKWKPVVYRDNQDIPEPGVTVGNTNGVDVGEQLKAVMAASFERRRVMNQSEYRAFQIVETELTNISGGFRLFAQTSLGEVLRSPSDDAFRAINAKRVDMLIVDPSGFATLAIEYLGEHHYQGTAAARDAIKKEALRKAGVKYLEIPTEFSEAQIRQRVREQLGIETSLTKSA